MAVGTINKITGILYILVGIVLMIIGVIVVQLIQNFLPLLQAFAGFTLPQEYFYAIAALLILPWIFFIIHGIAHYLIGRQIE
jgi:hypothetical protein